MKRFFISIFIVILILSAIPFSTVHAVNEPSFSVSSEKEYLEEPGVITVKFIINNTSEPIFIKKIQLIKIDGAEASIKPSWEYSSETPIYEFEDYHDVEYTKSMLGKTVTYELTYSIEGSDAVRTVTADLTIYKAEATVNLVREISNKNPIIGEEVTIIYKITNPNHVDTSIQLYDKEIILDNNARPEYKDLGVLPPGGYKEYEVSFIFDGAIRSKPSVKYACIIGKMITGEKSFDEILISEAKPSLSVTLTTSSTTVVPGTQIYLSLTVVNTGNIPINNITASSEQLNDIMPSKDLAPNETFTKNIAVTINSDITYKISVSGTCNGQTISALSDPLTIKSSAEPDINVSLTASAETQNLTGPGNITIKFTIQNNSGITYRNIEIFDRNGTKLLSFDRLGVGTQTFEKSIAIEKTSTLSFILKLKDTSGNSYTKNSNQITVTVSDPNNTVKPGTTTAPPPSPTPTQAPNNTGGFINLWSPLLTVLLVMISLTIISGISLVILLVRSYKIKNTRLAADGAEDIPSRRRNKKRYRFVVKNK